MADRIIMYRTVFGSDAGRKVLEDLEKTHHIHTPTFQHGDNQEVALIREGERITVLRIKGIIDSDLGKYIEEGKKLNKEDNDA